ncbi:hypothetical protein O6P43_020754 [Quillaja saponaria]|uniref:Uncharacterized protein n=1 Tax=Quillaja saponaria TaxID=32244 RepID=A0AAD7LLE1_QUISA|nr:hypothetical protein O6P43_020754 [Quillaja saponaria]
MFTIDEIEVAEILLDFPLLIAKSDHSSLVQSFPFSWGTKKRRTNSKPTPQFSNPKTPYSPNNESSYKPSNPKVSTENEKELALVFEIPDLNIPLPNPVDDHDQDEEQVPSSTPSDLGIIIMTNRATSAAQARKIRIQILRNKKKKMISTNSRQSGYGAQKQKSSVGHKNYDCKVTLHDGVPDLNIPLQTC